MHKVAKLTFRGAEMNFRSLEQNLETTKIDKDLGFSI